MGRWSQARRRASPPALSGAPGPPPAPTLGQEGASLVQRAQGGDDTGGRIELQQSLVLPYEWEDCTDDAWTPVKVWGNTDTLGLHYYRCRERGNDLNYVGYSEWSNVALLSL